MSVVTLTLTIDLAAAPGEVAVTFVPPGAQAHVTGTLLLRPVVRALPTNVRIAVIAALRDGVTGANTEATAMTAAATAIDTNADAWDTAITTAEAP